MTSGTPSTRNPFFEVMIKASHWLSARLGEPFMATAALADPAAMTDAQLREALCMVNHDLVVGTIGPWLMRSVDKGPVNDPRLPRPMPTSPLCMSLWALHPLTIRPIWRPSTCSCMRRLRRSPRCET